MARSEKGVGGWVFTTSQNNRVKENVLLLLNGIDKQHCKTLLLDDAIGHGSVRRILLVTELTDRLECSTSGSFDDELLEWCSLTVRS